MVFPVGRVHRRLKKGNYANRISTGAPIYLCAVLEYIVAEVLELAGNCATDNGRTRINPRHLTLAIRQDDELNKLFEHVIVSQGGIVPHINPILLPKKTAKASTAASSVGESGPSMSSQNY